MVGMRSWVAPVALASALILAGCARSARQHRDPDPEPAAGPTILRVTNNNTSDVDVYVSSGGDRRRLGMVVTGNTETFEIPRYLVGRSSTLQVSVRRIGGGGTYTTSVPLSAGQELDVNVAPVLYQSSVLVQASQ